MNKLLLVCLLSAGMGLSMPAMATTDALEPYLGEIKWVAFNFAPRGWAQCDGQLLPISSYPALFSLLGTLYGGDGRTTFALPDMRSNLAMGQWNSVGRYEGQRGGEEQHSLTVAALPSHSHRLNGSNATATTGQAQSQVPAQPSRSKLYRDAADSAMNGTAIGNSGSSHAHSNLMPYNTLNCIISLQGLFPSRN